MEHHDSHGTPSNKPIILSVILLTGLFFVATALGWTTKHAPAPASPEATPAEHVAAEEHAAEEHAEDSHADNSHATATPPLWAVLPFVMLLGAIALFPLLRVTAHWWESNLHRFYVALLLATVTLVYYVAFHPGDRIANVTHVLEHAILGEYIPFIVLLFSLYTVSGGVRIQGDLLALPLINVMFLLTGGLLASFIGTTGAAMLLIRPLLETNNERAHVKHTVVFFIFVVCNCGGCLLPIGDPPLFLGYLKGVSFFWTMKYLWWPWLLCNALILLVYYVLDRFYYYPKETAFALASDVRHFRPVTITGLWPNSLLMVGVIAAVAFLDPKKPIPGLGVAPPMYLREIVQLWMVALSLWMGSTAIRKANKFNYHAIVEVAALFVGIFICMQPAIQILHAEGANLGLHAPWQFYWATGGLSAVLDNAPTYVVFYETAAADTSFAGTNFAQLVSQSGELADDARLRLIAISLGAVFMGALTYIGNGPNFMVRAIAEQSNVRMPSFFGYVFKYSLPFLLPVFAIVCFVVLWH
jgi:Na+/H+ antiporter NhaD/arsenite permease-like protein